MKLVQSNELPSQSLGIPIRKTFEELFLKRAAPSLLFVDIFAAQNLFDSAFDLGQGLLIFGNWPLPVGHHGVLILTDGEGRTGERQCPEQGLFSLDTSGFLSQNGAEIRAVKWTFGGGDFRKSADGLEQIDESGRCVGDRTSCDVARPVENPGNSDTSLVVGPFGTPQIADAITPVTSIVRRVNNKCVFRRIDFSKLFDQSSDCLIGVRNGRRINRGWVGGLSVGFDQIRGSSQGGVGFMKPDVQKKRTLGLLSRVKPLDGIFDHQIAGVALELSDRLSVSDKITRISMTGLRIVGCGKPVIKSVFRRGGFVGLPSRWHAKVPFAEMGRIEAVRFQYLCQRCLVHG